MIRFVHQFIVPAAYALLPDRMSAPAATALLLAIGLQESKFLARQQLHGPAKSFWQFEVAGVAGVRTHPRTRTPLTDALRALRYPTTLPPSLLHAAIEDNDVLAAVCARLLLWTDPQALPLRDEADRAWTIYFGCWQPGRPRPADWAANYQAAWEIVS